MEWIQQVKKNIIPLSEEKEDLKKAFESTFEDTAAGEFDKNKDFFGKILKDDDFKKSLLDLLIYDIYSTLKNQERKNKREGIR